MAQINIEPIIQSLQFAQYLQTLQHAWNLEQEKRHAFWKNIDETQKAEFINGEGIYDSPVYGRHWMASTNMLRYIIPHVMDNKLGRVAVEKVMIRCSRNDYEPDICFWKTEKAKEFKQKQSAFPPPDFIIEILSQSTEYKDRGIKFQDYALHGVAEYWLVDTENQTVEQYFLKEDSYELHLKLNQGYLESPTIAEFRIAISDIFEEA